MLDAASPLHAVGLACTLNSSPTESSTEAPASQILELLKVHSVTGESIRAIDHDMRPGVGLDMMDGHDGRKFGPEW
jgi:hypothetical protein